MVERLVTRFRALLGGRGEDALVVDDLEDEAGVLGPDPEWDELLAWTRESDDEVEWTALIARAKQATAAEPADKAVAETDNEAAEWARLLALAKSGPAVPPGGSIASLTARLERMAAQVPDARRRRAR